MRTMTIIAILASAAATALAQPDKAMLPVTKLADAQPNVWARVGDLQTGLRDGSAMFYSEAIGRFVLAQGLNYNAKIVTPYDVQTLEPGKVEWQNAFPPGKEGAWGGPTGQAKAPGFPHSNNYWGFKDKEGNIRPPGGLDLNNGYAVAPDGSAFYIYVRGVTLVGIKPGCIWRYDVKERTWSQVCESHEIDVPAFSPPVELTGASLVYEPVNDELLLLCGQAPNVPGASVGNWAYSLKNKTWARLPDGSDAQRKDYQTWLSRQHRLEDATGRARSIYYLDLPADQKVARATKEVLPDVQAVLGELKKFVDATAVDDLAPREWAMVARAKRAVELAAPAAKALADGQLTGDVLAGLTRAGYELETVARIVSPVPLPRANASACYDPAAKVVVLFGGDRFDGVLNDTWVYNPADRSWKQRFPKVAPAPRARAALMVLPKAGRLALVGGVTLNHKFIYFSGLYQAMPADVWTYDVKGDAWSLLVPPTGEVGFAMPQDSSMSAVGPDDTIVSLSRPGGWPRHWDGGTWAVKLDASKVDAEAEAKFGCPPASKTSRAVTYDQAKDNLVYDPAWYDQAEPGDPAAVKAWADKLPANTWVVVPSAPRQAPQSEWGTAIFDAGRDRIYYWTGGHMSDPSNAFHTYYPAVNRWSIPYVAEIPLAKGSTFQSRPDCKNHTYLNYTLDPVTKLVVAATYGGTGIYDPDTGRWTMLTDMPFKASHYTMNLFGTPRGVLVWAEGFIGTFDAAARKYTPAKVGGQMPGYIGADRSGACWDSKRNVMWMFTAKSFTEASGQVWKLDIDKWQAEPMNPANMETVGKSTLYARENTYLPKADLVLTKGFYGRGQTARQIAWDPAGNRWVLTNIRLAVERIAGPVAMVYDPIRDLLWCMAGSRQVYVLRVDPKTLELSDSLPPPVAPKPDAPK
ncbi:MAG: hypothetical protein BIFFINMI_02607 [Phycisphaerae bacterium]|nr:hypothetical protein [Phycisphaerae bacterium]